MLGEFLEENCPDVAVKIVIKHQSEWPEFLDSVSKLSCNDLITDSCFVGLSFIWFLLKNLSFGVYN